jgi:hypothetical protein
VPGRRGVLRLPERTDIHQIFTPNFGREGPCLAVGVAGILPAAAAPLDMPSGKVGGHPEWRIFGHSPSLHSNACQRDGKIIAGKRIASSNNFSIAVVGRSCALRFELGWASPRPARGARGAAWSVKMRAEEGVPPLIMELAPRPGNAERSTSC